MQRVKDNPINNRLIQLYIKIFPKIEEIFVDEILVLKKSLIFKKPFLFKNHSLSYFVETPFAFLTGYFFAVFSSLFKMISSTSASKASAMKQQ